MSKLFDFPPETMLQGEGVALKQLVTVQTLGKNYVTFKWCFLSPQAAYSSRPLSPRLPPPSHTDLVLLVGSLGPLLPGRWTPVVATSLPSCLAHLHLNL